MPSPTEAVSPYTKSDSYQWVALSNTTIGMLAAAMNSSILLISLPAVFLRIPVIAIG